MTILIPGTGWTKLGGWGRDNQLFTYAHGYLARNSKKNAVQMLDDTSWGWAGGNTDAARIAAAKSLCMMIALHRFADGENLTIIAHSHGANVALAASHLGLAHDMDVLIALNKPTLSGNAYLPGKNIGTFYNISAEKDIIQWAGSNEKLSGKWSYDPHALNHYIDTSASVVHPHAALVWDDTFREQWWKWFLEQEEKEADAVSRMESQRPL